MVAADFHTFDTMDSRWGLAAAEGNTTNPSYDLSVAEKIFALAPGMGEIWRMILQISVCGEFSFKNEWRRCLTGGGGRGRGASVYEQKKDY
eukprot:scaffold347598_cov70-Cyclotella_meneghiniana.AAC.1